MHTPLPSSPQCYRSREGMLTIICVDTYASRRDRVCNPIITFNISQINEAFKRFGRGYKPTGIVVTRYDVLQI